MTGFFNVMLIMLNSYDFILVAGAGFELATFGL